MLLGSRGLGGTLTDVRDSDSRASNYLCAPLGLTGCRRAPAPPVRPDRGSPAPVAQALGPHAGPVDGRRDLDHARRADPHRPPQRGARALAADLPALRDA